jgi:DNA-directed RNA polymerase specialized sigma24 family protein
MQRDLVERARRGDHDAFAELAAAAISRLDSAAWLILRDPDQAKDAVQNALVKAWRDLPTLRDPDSFDAWLNRLLVRACIESSIADRDQLERGFVRLTPEMRAVIVLHHYLDLPLPAVAASLGIP